MILHWTSVPQNSYWFFFRGYAQQQFGGGHGGHGGGSGSGYHGMAHQMGQYGQQMFGHGGHGEHYGGHQGGYHGQMTDKQAMKEAMKFAKNKGNFIQIWWCC